GQLWLLEDTPELSGPGVAQAMRPRPPLPRSFGETGQTLRGRIGLQELLRQRRRQLRDLQGPRIVRLEGIRELVDQPRLLPDLPLVVFGEKFELLGGGRAGLQGLE